MSGRDHEPIAAFFPPIDRNLMRDLDRHLRGAATREPRFEASGESGAPQEFEASQNFEAHRDPEGRTSHDPAPQNVPSPPLTSAPAGRPSTNEVLEAVQQAASSMVSMGARIQELEAHQHELESINGQLRNKLGEMLQIQQASESRARAESERAAQAEQIAAQHLSRAQTLESDLETALGDLHRIAEAITGTLGIPHPR